MQWVHQRLIGQHRELIALRVEQFWKQRWTENEQYLFSNFYWSFQAKTDKLCLTALNRQRLERDLAELKSLIAVHFDQRKKDEEELDLLKGMKIIISTWDLKMFFFKIESKNVKMLEKFKLKSDKRAKRSEQNVPRWELFLIPPSLKKLIFIQFLSNKTSERKNS